MVGVTTPNRARGLALIWIAAIWAGSLALLLRYASITFNDLPIYDDWTFIDKYLTYSMHNIGGFEYFFSRHNGHPSVPARIAYLLSYRFDHLDLTWLRWGSVVGNIACAGLASWLMLRASRNEDAQQTFNLTHPAVVIGVPLCTLWLLSLGNWEIYSVAMCFSDVFATLSVLSAVLLFDMWLQKRRALLLISATLMAVSATFSMTQGVLVWVAFAAMALAHPKRRKLLPATGTLLALFAIGMVWTMISIGGHTDRTRESVARALASPFVMLGSDIFGLIGNQSILELDFAVGVVVAGAAAYVVIRTRWLDQDQLLRAAPFLGLAVYAAGTIAMIAWGRQDFPMSAYGASRYVELTIPALVALVGLLCIGTERARLDGQLLAGVLALALVGWAVTNFDENAMGPMRAGLMKKMTEGLRDDRVPKTKDWLSANLFLDQYSADLAQKIVPLLDQKKLSVFSSQSPIHSAP